MDATHPAALTAAEAARLIQEGLLTSERLVEACLERIHAAEPEVQAWTFLDEELALALLYVFPQIGLWLPSVFYGR